MKQNYIKPQTTVLELEVAEMMATSFIDYTSEIASDEYEVLSNKRRGSWGNLWE